MCGLHHSTVALVWKAACTLSGVACFVTPPELEITYSIEEHLKPYSTRVVRTRRRRHSRKNAGTKFLVALLFAATAAITWQFARPQPASSLAYSSPQLNPVGLDEADPSGMANPAYPSYSGPRTGRLTYLYSVIPGGIANAEELQQAMDRDPVVAREFEGFDFQRAHLVQVSQKQSMHVAYRKGDKVYWTRKKLPLQAGETLITDGKIVARTRCGNRIARIPLGPPALVDPVEADFNQPLFSNDMVTRDVEPEPVPYADALPVEANTFQPSNGRRMLPFFIPPFFGGSTGSSPSPHTPLTPAPEPGALLLVSTGLVGVYWKARNLRRKR